ncbi:hypothetical protein GY45DRAFT_1260812 [Cubamyces sp. BRFM 1775]|nr:hypothetical protein GY45DRAFT_1260812 [Cubamyces sp. BRFM 1775]
MHTKKAQLVPPSSFSEPSEPSQLRPEDKPERTLRGEQEENPQLVAHAKGKQSEDHREQGRHSSENDGDRGGRVRDDEAERADEEKKADVAGGFGVGRAKL